MIPRLHPGSFWSMKSKSDSMLTSKPDVEVMDWP
jgi:hypothetical protein